jgi:hypothetical protein
MDTSAGSAGVARTLDAALAIASAAVIAYGVLVLGWSVFTVMALFWFENVVIGGFNVLRMLVSGARIGGAGTVGAGAMAAFFTVHYGGFTAAHGFVVLLLFGLPELGHPVTERGSYGPLGPMVQTLFANREGWLALAAIVVTMHAVSFVKWAMVTRERPTPVKELMAAPYGRMVVLHIALLAGAFLIMSLKAPEPGVLLLVALKLGYDLITLRRGPQKKEEHEAQTRRLLVVGRRNLR